MSFSSRLKQRRKELGLTQEDLAKALGVTKGAIGNYESDVSSPRADILYQLFEVLQCDANYLYQDDIKAQDDEKAACPIKYLYERLTPENQALLMSLAEKLTELEHLQMTEDSNED